MDGKPKKRQLKSKIRIHCRHLRKITDMAFFKLKNYCIKACHNSEYFSILSENDIHVMHIILELGTVITVNCAAPSTEKL